MKFNLSNKKAAKMMKRKIAHVTFFIVFLFSVISVFSQTSIELVESVPLETSLDISTVSRVANSKYVQTEFGTKRLKEFFSESLSTQDGEEVSTLEVKKVI